MAFNNAVFFKINGLIFEVIYLLLEHSSICTGGTYCMQFYYNSTLHSVLHSGVSFLRRYSVEVVLKEYYNYTQAYLYLAPSLVPPQALLLKIKIRATVPGEQRCLSLRENLCVLLDKQVSNTNSSANRHIFPRWTLLQLQVKSKEDLCMFFGGTKLPHLSPLPPQRCRWVADVFFFFKSWKKKKI